MKIAIIGGCGFIGQRLVKNLLNADHNIVIGDLNKSTDNPDLWVYADLRDKQSLENACSGCDVIYNLAAEHRDDVQPLSLYTDVNVTGSQNLCDVADKLGIKHIIFTSSVAIYGFPQGEPDENTHPNPFNEYGRTKWEAEKVYTAWQKNDPAKTLTIIRPTAVFGPGNRGNVYNLIRQIASGKFIMIGNGKNKKSLAYVDNLSAFLAKSLKFPAGNHDYNYIDKPDFDMNTLVTLVRETLGKGNGTGLRLPYSIGFFIGACFDVLAKLTGKTFPVSKIRVQKFCASTVFSADKITQSGFKPPVNMHTALKDTLIYEFPDRAK